MTTESERQTYLARVASLYYDQGRTEDELAQELNVTPVAVAQLLNEARESGVIEIIVHQPRGTVEPLEAALCARFRLKAARVLVRDGRTEAEVVAALGALGADYLTGQIQTHSVIGISWGSALAQLIKALRPNSLPDTHVVQLIGATGNEHIGDGPQLAQLLANRLGSRCHYLHAPLVVDSAAGRDALLADRSLRETLAWAERATLALVGIGSTDDAHYSLLRAGYVDADGLSALRAAGAVGDVCAQHFGADGAWLDIDLNRRVIGISLSALSKVEQVIGVAGGPHKVDAILAALRGGHVDVLVTDDETAQSILARAAGTVTPTPVEPPAGLQAARAALRGIWKVFDGVPVLRGVDIDVRPGEVHALLGGNGSGKSTLMKVLSGVHLPDAGSVELDGRPVVLDGPARAHELGVYLVPQEPKIFPHLTVEENLLVGTQLEPLAARERIKRYAAELGFDADLAEEAGGLTIANQQLLEIIRGLLRNARVLVFDEPTSTLTFREVDALFTVMRALAERGIGQFFISHRLSEVLAISQRISVLRDGVLVLSEPTGRLTTRDLIRAMLPADSRAENGSAEPTERPAVAFGAPALELRGLSGEAFHNVSLRVRAGEVVGLAGLVGAGRTELAHAILGLDAHVQGEVLIQGRPAQARTLRRCQELGLVYVPEDRHAHGIFLELAYPQTITASVLAQLGRFLLSGRQERALADDYVGRLEIKVNALSQLGKTLSGGNQQKVVLAKCLASRPRVVILDEPTRGVDAKARQDVYRLVEQLTADGVAVLLISSDLEEVVQLSDRVLVMFHGGIVDELTRAQFQMERITAAAFGLRGEA